MGKYKADECMHVRVLISRVFFLHDIMVTTESPIQDIQMERSMIRVDSTIFY